EDDVALIYLRRDGGMAAAAARDAYHRLPASVSATQRVAMAARSDTTVRRELRIELERASWSSRRNANAEQLLGNLDMDEGRWRDAAAHYTRAFEVAPVLPGLRLRRGMARLWSGEGGSALEDFEAARRHDGRFERYDLLRGEALALMGRKDEAR